MSKKGAYVNMSNTQKNNKLSKQNTYNKFKGTFKVRYKSEKRLKNEKQ